MNKRITLFSTILCMVLSCKMVNAQLQHHDFPAPAIDQLLKKIEGLLQQEHMPGLMHFICLLILSKIVMQLA